METEIYILSLVHCYEIIMFGRVIYTRHAARRECSLFTSFTFCNVIGSCSLRPKEYMLCPSTCVLLIEILAMINLYYHSSQEYSWNLNN